MVIGQARRMARLSSWGRRLSVGEDVSSKDQKGLISVGVVQNLR